MLKDAFDAALRRQRQEAMQETLFCLFLSWFAISSGITYGGLWWILYLPVAVFTAYMASDWTEQYIAYRELGRA